MLFAANIFGSFFINQYKIIGNAQEGNNDLLLSEAASVSGLV